MRRLRRFGAECGVSAGAPPEIPEAGAVFQGFAPAGRSLRIGAGHDGTLIAFMSSPERGRIAAMKPELPVEERSPFHEGME